MKPPRLVLVRWEDASVDTETWVFRKSPPDPKVCMHEQVGWLLELTPKHLVMTCTISDELIGARTRVPRAMVRKITYLRRPS